MSYGQYSPNHAERRNPLANKPTSKRVKHVFKDNSEIAHLWFHQAQDSARNPQGNFYFEGDTVYSYGSHFPIARLVEHNGRKAVLETVRTYGPTTGGHQSVVRSAIRTWNGSEWLPTNGITIFAVERPDNAPSEMIKEWSKRIANAQNYALTDRRIQKKTRAKLFEAILTLTKQANQFAEFFELPDRFDPPADIETLCEFIMAERAKALEETAKRELKQREGIIQHCAKIREYALPDWLAHGLEHLKKDGQWLTVADLPEAYLRVNEDGQVATSHHATVPLEHVLRILPIVKRLYASGETYKRNGHTIHLGHYALDEIDAQGNVKAGCHYFERSEVERFIALLENSVIGGMVAKGEQSQ